MADRVAGCAHPLEKSAPGFKKTSIHGLVARKKFEMFASSLEGA
jgi:hypothetical protein